jgi:hypothetical protein
MISRLRGIEPDEANSLAICPDSISVDCLDGARLDSVRRVQSQTTP